MLKAREEAIIQERIDLRRKQWVSEKITEEFPHVRIPIEKVKVMKVFDIVSIRENLRWTKIQHMAAAKIQRKYRRYVESKDFGPNMQLSLYEIKKMLDKVRVI